MSAAGGHVGILVSRSKQLPQTIADWLQKR
jgi:hypothetical protein